MSDIAKVIARAKDDLRIFGHQDRGLFAIADIRDLLAEVERLTGGGGARSEMPPFPLTSAPKPPRPG